MQLGLLLLKLLLEGLGLTQVVVDTLQVCDLALVFLDLLGEFLLKTFNCVLVLDLVVRDGFLELTVLLLQLGLVFLQLFELLQVLVDPCLVLVLLLLHHSVDLVEFIPQASIFRFPKNHNSRSVNFLPAGFKSQSVNGFQNRDSVATYNTLRR